MKLPRSQWSHQLMGMIMFVLLISFAIPVSSTPSNKVEQGLVPREPHTSIKCGECPCVNPCGQLPPPPPPPPPPPSPPPPPNNKYCSPLLPQPPPPPRFIFVTGVPGEIYQTDEDRWEFYSRGERNVAKKLLLLVGFAVLGFLTIW